LYQITLLCVLVCEEAQNPASLETKSNDRVKTDKRDAKKMAEHLGTGRLKGIYVPSVKEEARRSITRGREQAKDRRKTIGNQLKMKLYYLGHPIDTNTKLSNKVFDNIEKLQIEREHLFVLKELIQAWKDENERIKRYNRELLEQAKEDENEAIYRSAPGVGALTARVLSNELGDMNRFKNERQLFSATGLTPSEYSSGDKIRRGNISRQGSGRIRGILTEVSWIAIKKDRSLKNIYMRIAKTRGGKRAIVAIARKILGRLRHCLKHQVMWQDMLPAASHA
jgi:transposase